MEQLAAEGKLVLPLCPTGPLAQRVSGGSLLTIQKSGQDLWGELSAPAFFAPFQGAGASATARTALADGLARWFALEEFLRSDLPLRILLKATSAQPPNPSSVPWLLETENAVFWIEPS